MVRKIFLLGLAILLVIQGAASAKKNDGLPESGRIKIAVEIKDSSRYKELNTAQNLELFLREELIKKNLVNVVGTKTFGEEKQSDGDLILDEDVTAEEKSSAENIGEILIFDAIELPRDSKTPEDFDKNFYESLGADYVVHCEVLALGAIKVEDKMIGISSGVIGSGISLAGHGSSSRDKTLRRVGTGIGTLGLFQMLEVTKRTALNAVVNMKFISVATGELLWEKNFVGQAIKHHKPSRGYKDVWTQAYMESVEDSAKLISKYVNKYVDKVIIKGKSDKEFKTK